MSEIRVNILDRDAAIHGDLHGSFCDALLASLMAEPETVDEYSTALSRFVKPTDTWTPLRGFRKGEDLEPYDAGIFIIDLAGRVIGFESTYSYPGHEGSVRIDSEFGDFAQEDGYVYIPYKIPNDWRIVRGVPEFEGMSLVSRKERSARPEFDARSVLYGRPLIEFLLDSLSKQEDPEAVGLFTEIHAEWLMSARSDLFGKTPREVLFERREAIDFDLHTRSLQYSFTKLCPKPLASESFAYRFAGFGTHEIVIYYYLIRELLYETVQGLRNRAKWDREGEIQRLEKHRDFWLESANPEFRRTPAQILESERKRLNLTVSAEECFVDDDCPICVSMYEDFDTPMFWHLDGCNMDERFEFSLYETREEWQAEQERYAQFNADYDAGKFANWRSEAMDDEEEPF